MKGLVAFHDSTLHIDKCCADRQLLKDKAKLCLVPLQRLLCSIAYGDIPEDTLCEPGLTDLVLKDHALVAHPNRVAIAG